MTTDFEYQCLTPCPLSSSTSVRPVLRLPAYSYLSTCVFFPLKALCFSPSLATPPTFGHPYLTTTSTILRKSNTSPFLPTCLPLTPQTPFLSPLPILRPVLPHHTTHPPPPPPPRPINHPHDPLSVPGCPHTLPTVPQVVGLGS